MTRHERAQRIAAWIWAAETLGVELTPERADGLVDVTARVRLDTLKPALQSCQQTETSGFLPAPGVVIAAANRISGQIRERLLTEHYERLRERERLAAKSIPRDPEAMKEIRDRIEFLARGKQAGWRPENAINHRVDDASGLSAARRATNNTVEDES